MKHRSRANRGEDQLMQDVMLKHSRKYWIWIPCSQLVLLLPCCQGPVRRSFDRGETRLDLDPASPGTNQNLALQFYFARRFDEALEQFRKTLEMDYQDAHLGLGLVYTAKGMYREALPEFEKNSELARGTPGSIAILAYAHARLNDRRHALQALDDLRALSKQRYVPSASFATVYLGLGERDQTFMWLEKAYQDRARLPMLRVDPIWDSLRSDARFQDLMTRVGLPP